MISDQQSTWAKILILSSLGPITALCCFSAIPARAETKSFDFTLSSSGERNFEALVQQAESVASNLIEKEFAKRSSLTEVSVTIVGERNGQEVPLLFSKVSRSNWQTKPKIQRWTKYFGKAAVLLGFKKPEGSQAISPTQSSVAISSTAESLSGGTLSSELSNRDDPAFRDD